MIWFDWSDQCLQNPKNTSYQINMRVSSEFDNDFDNSNFDGILGKKICKNADIHRNNDN